VAQPDRRLLLVFCARPAGVPGGEGRAVGPSLCMDRLPRTRRMLHVGLPAMRDGRRPEVRTPVITEDVSRETVAVPHGGAVRPARGGCGRRRPRPADGRRQLLRGARQCGALPALPRATRLGRLAAGPDAWTCRMCQMFHVEPQAMLGGPPPRIESRGSPGWADRGRAPRVDARRVGHATDHAAPGAAAAFRRSARRPGMPGCFTWNRRQCSGVRRTRMPGLSCLTKDVRRCSAIGARRSGPPGFTWNRRSSVAVASRSGCPDGPDVSRGT
jgi:hypothetical protein